jgi:type I restriction enzyme, S subunit
MSWKKVKLGDLCTIEKGKTGIQKAISGEYPLVVTAEERKSHNEYQFDDEAVIIPLVSGTGHGHASIKRLHFQSGKFALGSILCAVIPKDKSILNAEYLFRFLNLNKERELVDRMKGMANVTLPIKEIAKIEIPLPSLEMQIEFIEKYALLETDSEDISSELTHQLDLIKQLRQAFLREAMQGRFEFPQQPLTEALEGNGFETGQQLLEKIKAEKAQLIAEKKLKKEKELSLITEDEIPFEIPEHWVWCRLGEICNYGSSPKAEPKDLNENTWVLDLEDIEKETSVLLNKIRFIERNSLSTKSIFKKGDVLYSKLRPYLDKVIVADEDGVCTTEILPLKLYGNINPYFLKYSLKRSDFLIYVNSVTKGMKMPRLGTTDGQSALIPLPPLQEQEQIVAKLEELMAFCDGLEQSIKEIQGYNEKLLQQVLREAL